MHIVHQESVESVTVDGAIAALNDAVGAPDVLASQRMGDWTAKGALGLAWFTIEQGAIMIP